MANFQNNLVNALRLGDEAVALELLQGGVTIGPSVLVEELTDIPSGPCPYIPFNLEERTNNKNNMFLMSATCCVSTGVRVFDRRKLPPPYPTLLGMALNYGNTAVVKAMLEAGAMGVVLEACEAICDLRDALEYNASLGCVTAKDPATQALLEKHAPLAMLQHHFLSIVVSGMAVKPCEERHYAALTDDALTTFERNFELLEMLLDAGCDVNFGTVRAPSHSFIFEFPIIAKTVRMVRDADLFSRVLLLFLRHNVDLNVVEAGSSTPIELATTRDDVGLVKALLDSRGCQVGVAGSHDKRSTFFYGDCKTLLQHAAIVLAVRCLDLLLNYTTKEEYSIDDPLIFTFAIDAAEPENDMAPVHLIFCRNHFSNTTEGTSVALRLLLANGADVNRICSRSTSARQGLQETRQRPMLLSPLALLLANQASGLHLPDVVLLRQVQMLLDSGADTSFLYEETAEDVPGFPDIPKLPKQVRLLLLEAGHVK